MTVPGGCRSQGCHGYPSRSARSYTWPHLPCFRHHSPSLSIVMSFIELNIMALHAHAKDHTRAAIKGCNLQHLLQLSILDTPKMQWAKLSVVDRIQPKLTGFDMGVGNKA